MKIILFLIVLPLVGWAYGKYLKHKKQPTTIQTNVITFYKGDVLSYLGELYDFIEYQDDNTRLLAGDEAGQQVLLWTQDCTLVQRKTTLIDNYNQYINEVQVADNAPKLNPQELRAKKKKLNKRRKLNRIAKESRRKNRR